MADRIIEWEKARRDEKEAREIEAENYRILMLQLAAFQTGNGVKLRPEMFQNWKASMQNRLNHALYRVALAKP